MKANQTPMEADEPDMTREGVRELRSEIDNLRRQLQSLAREVNDLQCVRFFFERKWAKLRKRLARAPKQVQLRLQRWQSAPPPYEVRHTRTPSPDRKRVLHVIGNFHIGGSAQLVVDIVEHLGDAYEHHVLARELPDSPAYTGLSLSQAKRFNSARAALDVLKRLQPDLVHVHYLGHWNNAYSLFDWGWYRNMFEALEQYGCTVVENVNIPVEPYFSRCVNSYVFVSDYVRHKFAFHDCNNVTIHPGSDLSLFKRLPHQPFADDHIGMIYRLDPDKLDERSIDTFIEVVRLRPETRVSIVGGGRFMSTYRDSVQAAAVAHAFDFPGYVPYKSLPDWLEKMSLFVAPVHTESFGQVTPFAMGMMLPVAGYAVGALNEIISAPTLLAPPGDAKALATIIVDLLNDRDRRLQIGAANRRRAESLFSVESMTAAYGALYADLLRRASANRHST